MYKDILLFGPFLDRTVGHVGYLIGSRGETCTPAGITRARANYSQYAYTIDNYAAQWLTGNPDMGAKPEIEPEAWKVADCMGWGEMWANGGDIGNPLDPGEFVLPDVSTGMAFEKAKSAGRKWGTIDTLPTGLSYPVVVYKKGHVGYWWKGKVYQSAGHKSGTIITSLSTNAWTHWFELPAADYSNAEETDMISIRGQKNEATRSVQRGLIRLGYDLGKYLDDAGNPTGADGEHGPTTAAQIAKFQAVNKLPVNGDQFGIDDNTVMIKLLAALESGVSQSDLDAVKADLATEQGITADLSKQLAKAKAVPENIRAAWAELNRLLS